MRRKGGGGTSGNAGDTKRRRLARRWADAQESARRPRVLCARPCQRSLGQTLGDVVAGVTQGREGRRGRCGKGREDEVQPRRLSEGDVG